MTSSIEMDIAGADHYPAAIGGQHIVSRLTEYLRSRALVGDRNLGERWSGKGNGHCNNQKFCQVSCERIKLDDKIGMLAHGSHDLLVCE